MQADWLFLLTDVPALYTANPSTNPTAQPIPEVHEVAELQVLLTGLVHPILQLQGLIVASAVPGVSPQLMNSACPRWTFACCPSR